MAHRILPLQNLYIPVTHDHGHDQGHGKKSNTTLIAQKFVNKEIIEELCQQILLFTVEPEVLLAQFQTLLSYFKGDTFVDVKFTRG